MFEVVADGFDLTTVNLSDFVKLGFVVFDQIDNLNSVFRRLKWFDQKSQFHLLRRIIFLQCYSDLTLIISKTIRRQNSYRIWGSVNRCSNGTLASYRTQASASSLISI
jgi:hypothetical protein